MTTKARREKAAPPGVPKGQLRLDGAPELNGEAWLARRLHEWHGVPDVFDGDTTTESRKAAVRAAINQHGLEWVICGRDSVAKKTLTWGDTFQRLYGERL